ncbi:hypothetical protein M406DRAFT_330797 [Cryphonectria parasitica EP155]|uniref:Uncharacterized protein n=1 Tax=Cryphonectria parasitica (strain ATCC 38755 / EP155) TaxID=660469 RepID=A0A9P5CNL9_CRYP1|nr:uncharacterized protein M406DRAFT_330797 [Cryphonectria parasitica EP155]KAF3764462.1 hypothetical protein M406DRAFT_330797 [Cryphonectria parasitica EP155]
MATIPDWLVSDPVITAALFLGWFFLVSSASFGPVFRSLGLMLAIILTIFSYIVNIIFFSVRLILLLISRLACCKILQTVTGQIAFQHFLSLHLEKNILARLKSLKEEQSEVARRIKKMGVQIAEWDDANNDLIKKIRMAEQGIGKKGRVWEPAEARQPYTATGWVDTWQHPISSRPSQWQFARWVKGQMDPRIYEAMGAVHHMKACESAKFGAWKHYQQENIDLHEILRRTEYKRFIVNNTPDLRKYPKTFTGELLVPKSSTSYTSPARQHSAQPTTYIDFSCPLVERQRRTNEFFSEDGRMMHVCSLCKEQHPWLKSYATLEEALATPRFYPCPERRARPSDLCPIISSAFPPEPPPAKTLAELAARRSQACKPLRYQQPASHLEAPPVTMNIPSSVELSLAVEYEAALSSSADPVGPSLALTEPIVSVSTTLPAVTDTPALATVPVEPSLTSMGVVPLVSSDHALEALTEDMEWTFEVPVDFMDMDQTPSAPISGPAVASLAPPSQGVDKPIAQPLAFSGEIVVVRTPVVPTLESFDPTIFQDQASLPEFPVSSQTLPAPIPAPISVSTPALQTSQIAVGPHFMPVISAASSSKVKEPEAAKPSGSETLETHAPASMQKAQVPHTFSISVGPHFMAAGLAESTRSKGSSPAAEESETTTPTEEELELEWWRLDKAERDTAERKAQRDREEEEKPKQQGEEGKNEEKDKRVDKGESSQGRRRRRQCGGGSEWEARREALARKTGYVSDSAGDLR